ncbi:hypothetical protein TSMEX_003258, partial [Taenia solium]
EGVSSNVTTTSPQVIVDGLPPRAKQNDVRSLFGRFGAISKTSLNEKTHRGIVTFSTANAAQMAVAAPPPRLKGANLRIYLPDSHERRCANT